jgi:lysylphosphatidylglycerol synthetase-like protein (DUF2156 family)
LPLGGLGVVERVLWFVLGWMCVVSALGMGRRPAPEWAVALLMVALGLYFANFTYVHYAQNNWLQAIAGVGLMGAALWHAAVVWTSPPTETPTQSGG